jgi:hypothetical protein
MPGGGSTLDTGFVSNDVSLTGVRGIRARLKGRSNSSRGPNNDHVAMRVYELQTFATLYEDHGLRVNDGGVITPIGCVVADTSTPFRFRKNGVTYGAALIKNFGPSTTTLKTYKGGVPTGSPYFLCKPYSTDIIQLSDTTHTYSCTVTATGVGSNSIDGNQSTSYSCEQPNTEQYRSGYITVLSQHDFSLPRNLSKIMYKVYCYGYAYGDDVDQRYVEYNIEYTTNGTDWITYASASAGNWS